MKFFTPPRYKRVQVLKLTMEITLFVHSEMQFQGFVNSSKVNLTNAHNTCLKSLFTYRSDLFSLRFAVEV